MSAPPPSRLCFLSGLPAKRAGDKVRFLGCVTAYDPPAGVLTLRHEHPPGTRVRALVDVELVLERLTAELVAVGAWVNVMGYVVGGWSTAAPEGTVAATPAAGAAAGAVPDAGVRVQALLLWAAGPLDVANYERRVAEMLA